MVDEAEKYQNERDKILADNEGLHNTVKYLEKEYKEKSFELEYKYHNKIHKLEKENNHLYKIIDKFWNTLEKFISWISKKFAISEEDNLIRDFQKETNTFIDPEKQIKHEEREKEWELER